MKPKSQKAIILNGGLDVVTSQLSVEEGRLLECRNYECDVNGGYRQFSGYERFDGRVSPSEGEFLTILISNNSGPFTDGETITGGTSGATGEIFYQSTDAIYLGNTTGTFAELETLTGGTSGETATADTPSYANVVVSEFDTPNNIRFRKENYYRQFIQAVPGVGEVRGQFRHVDVTLAGRDIDITNKLIYKSTPAGWVEVPRVHVVFFEAGVLAEWPQEGTVINDGTNNATVHRIGGNLITGESGYLTLTDWTVGFGDGAALQVGSTVFATVSAGGAASQYEMAAGGRLEWLSHTFSGNPDRYRCYFTDGVNPAMEYDPVADIIGPIYTDLADIPNDTPAFLEEYKNHLFVGYERGIVRNSEPIDIYFWDAAAGSLETQVGSPVTGMESAPSSLIITAERTIYALTGGAAENFQLDVAGKNVGGKPYTVNTLGTTHMFDDRGIIELSRVQAFGNFENATVSRRINPIIASLVNNIQASVPNLTNNILRFFTRDGDGISMTFQEGKVFGFGLYSLNKDLFTISNAEDEQGRERTFFGGLDGYVYEMDRGRNFDGEEKEAWLQTTYNHLGSPTQRKRFFRAFFSGLVSGQSTVQMVAQYSNGSADVADTATQEDTALGNKAGWDIGEWDVMFFDAASQIGDVYLDLEGTGDTISIIVYSNTTEDDILTLRDVLYHYKPRRAMRSGR